MLKITITGGTGFVGINLHDFLKDDYQVDLLSVRFKENQKITIHSDIVIHLAGKAHDLKKVSKPNEYYEANFELTKQLFDAFLESEASVFIFMSTVKAVTDKVDGILTEDFIPNPITYYGKAKLQAEEYLLSKILPKGKRIYILRPCMIHGPKNKGNLNLLYKLVSKGLPWPLGAFENQRSFLSIDNLCFVIKELIDNDLVPTGVYNLSDDKALSTNELIKILEKSLGKQNLIWNINPSFIIMLAKIGDYTGLPLNSERLEKLTENYAVSNDKIVNSIGKSFPMSIEAGLIKTFRSFKE
ncbi:NAD-dependent epimerase/dehydratase family protein [Flavobacterium collinsii]|uniref:UDP-glucose 4-epimerase n=1 Tax=Flavobacterium collinsii TaxID=1114861 RepID=A0A9W4TEE2_9FLAO|nr:NAD-dependent epimerase/dehydratase family protein [Flavobacterium collinsii]CAI2765411.1 UDP-glucose 4-epimerase [Flavobacterium collinsii]